MSNASSAAGSRGSSTTSARSAVAGGTGPSRRLPRGSVGTLRALRAHGRAPARPADTDVATAGLPGVATATRGALPTTTRADTAAPASTVTILRRRPAFSTVKGSAFSVLVLDGAAAAAQASASAASAPCSLGS